MLLRSQIDLIEESQEWELSETMSIKRLSLCIGLGLRSSLLWPTLECSFTLCGWPIGHLNHCRLTHWLARIRRFCLIWVLRIRRRLSMENGGDCLLLCSFM